MMLALLMMFRSGCTSSIVFMVLTLAGANWAATSALQMGGWVTEEGIMQVPIG